MGISEVSTTLKRRLETIDIGNNLGRDRRCKCGEEDTEHIIKCEKNRGIGRLKEEWLKETEKGFEISKINRRMERYIEEREKIKRKNDFDFGKNKTQRITSPIECFHPYHF